MAAPFSSPHLRAFRAVEYNLLTAFHILREIVQRLLLISTSCTSRGLGCFGSPLSFFCVPCARGWCLRLLWPNPPGTSPPKLIDSSFLEFPRWYKNVG